MKELNQYYRQIKGWLPCGGKVKKTLMTNITATIEGYIADNPGLDFAAVQAHFGTPQQIAAAFVDEMGTEELLTALRLRRKIVKIVLGVAFAALAIYAIAILTIWLAGMIAVCGEAIVHPPKTVG